ncbi:7858_t:CDS:2 [Diversispora eburnea]|uniref:7858_t:CDS:1 n=1 Tax=Diversispora eburnea TaxID=1213867 RepID=A0A9N8WI02_9GLOM|nr:7858_t:CDS:2 [Diversispora eburnea]
MSLSLDLLALIGFFCTGDLFYACCRNKYNNNLPIKTIEKGTRPEPYVSDDRVVDSGVDVHYSVEDFGMAFGNVLNFAFKERISLIGKLDNTSRDSNIPLWKRALKAFKHAAKVYKAKSDKPAVIVYDSVCQLVHQNPEILDFLQGDAKDNAYSGTYIAVFVSKAYDQRSKGKKIYELVGGCIVELEKVANKFIDGQSFEDQKHYEAGKRVINVL